jgi:hypothetical protein
VSPTGEPATDALTLLDMEPRQRAEFYCAMQRWPPDYRERVFELYDEVALVEQARAGGRAR